MNDMSQWRVLSIESVVENESKYISKNTWDFFSKHYVWN